MAHAQEFSRPSRVIAAHGHIFSSSFFQLAPDAYKKLSDGACNAVARLQSVLAKEVSVPDQKLFSRLLGWPENVGFQDVWGGVPDTSLGCHRCDMIFDGDEWQVIEVNSMNAGGWMIPRLYAAHIGCASKQPPIRDPASCLFAHLVEASACTRSRHGTRKAHHIAMVRSEPNVEFDDRFLEECRAIVAALDPASTVGYSQWSDLVFTDDSVSSPQGELGIIIELDIVPTLRRVQAANMHLRKQICFVAGPIARLVNDKRWMAHDGVRGNPFAETCALGSTEDDWRRLVLNRSNTVLKRATSDGGDAVYPGRFCVPHIWERLVRSACNEGGWVYQHWISPKLPPGHFVGADFDIMAHLIWSPFVIGGSFSGGFVRVLSPDGYGGDPALGEQVAVAIKRSFNSDSRIPVFPIYSPDILVV